MIMSTTKAKANTMKALLTGILFAGAGVALSACGPVAPVSPTWKDDVRPLVLARCVRCHDSPPTNAAPFTLNYAEFGQIPPSTAALGPPDYAPGTFLRGLGVATHSGHKPMRMPPPPSAALEDWQTEILDNWSVNPR
jgi:hypothetical protein